MGAGVLSTEHPGAGPGSSSGGEASVRFGGEARPRLGGDPFPRLGGILRCGHHSLEDVAKKYTTPLYVYDGDRILERLAALRDAFATHGPNPAAPGLVIAYSVKANPGLAILKLLARAGAGADIVSGGELHRSLHAGVPAGRIVFAGVGKTRDEMRYGLESGIRAFHVESAQELDVLGSVATDLGQVAPIAVRVNPDVDSPTHAFTRTGHARAKFGVSPKKALEMYRVAAEHPRLRAVGVDVHIGSQIRDPVPFLNALDVVLEVAGRVRGDLGIDLEYVDLGGGFGISDGEADELDVRTLAGAVTERLRGTSLTLVLEPGRFLVGDAGVLLTQVLYVKRSGGKTFVITDAGMTDLIRPSHYGGVHAVSLVREQDAGPVEAVDVVGPVCEQGDFLARDRRLPLPRPGALLCVHQAGAYGFTMSSNYNSRPRPAEVLVRGDHVTRVRRRESFSDLIRDEVDE